MRKKFKLYIIYASLLAIILLALYSLLFFSGRINTYQPIIIKNYDNKPVNFIAYGITLFGRKVLLINKGDTCLYSNYSFYKSIIIHYQKEKQSYKHNIFLYIGNIGYKYEIVGNNIFIKPACDRGDISYLGALVSVFHWSIFQKILILFFCLCFILFILFFQEKLLNLFRNRQCLIKIPQYFIKIPLYHLALIVLGFTIIIIDLSYYFSNYEPSIQYNIDSNWVFILLIILYVIYSYIYTILIIHKKYYLQKFLSHIFMLVISSYLIIHILNIGVQTYGDTPTYTQFLPMRPPIYPLYLYFFQHIIVSNFIMLVTNGFLGIISAYLLSSFIIQKSFQNKFLLPVIFLIFLLPYFRFLSPETSLANVLIAESITYPLFLIVIYTLCKLIYSNFSLKHIIFLNISILLLLLTRGHFTCPIYIIIIILILILFIKKHHNKFKFIYIFLTTIFLLNIIQITYFHKLFGVSKTSALNSTQYIQIAGRPFYISKQSDSALFIGENKKIFKEISDSLDVYNLRFNENTDIKNCCPTYMQKYEAILWKVSFPIFKKHQKIYDWFEIDKTARQFSLKIIQNHFSDYIKTTYIHLKTVWWTKINYLEYFIISIFLVVFFGYFYIRNNHPLNLLIVLVLIMQSSKIALVALTAFLAYRYLFYFDFVFLIIAILCVNYMLKKILFKQTCHYLSV